MDEFRVYEGRALSAVNVAGNYGLQLTAGPGLVMSLTFDDPFDIGRACLGGVSFVRASRGTGKLCDSLSMNWYV